MPSPRAPKIIFLLAAIAACTPYLSSVHSLLLGILVSVAFGNPFPAFTKKWTSRLLQLSVIGLGAGMNLQQVLGAGMHGILYTIVGIALTCLFGLMLGKWLGVERETSLLVTVGTAICGGSAIAAVSPVIQAKHNNVSFALVTVFFLNALALFLFPGIGRFFHLSESQFGLWSALAIHDTSSVLGAALQYGQGAVDMAVPVKLARALWIVPLTFAIGYFWKKDGTQTTAVKHPWFILGFVLMAAFVTWIPELAGTGEIISSVAKRSLVFTLFLIGTGLSRESLRAVGVRPLLHGFILWLAVSSVTLASILQFTV